MSGTVPKRALQFGAGNNGRGFIGCILSQSGYEVTFVDVFEPLIELINRRGQYTVREVDASGKGVVTVENINALNAKAEADVIGEIEQATLITTAVGPAALPKLVPVIAKGLQRRAEQQFQTPLNIIACENLTNNSTVLQEQVLDYLSVDHQDYVKRCIGFPCCVVDTVITAPGEAERKKDMLLVIAERDGLLVIDQNQFVGELPDIKKVLFTNNFEAYVEQKIFTMNMAHAITAYLGYLKGYEFIHEALQDPTLQPVVRGALREVNAVLKQRHNFESGVQERYANKVFKRFTSIMLTDPITRVARDPRRKLAPSDRLVRPARLGLEIGITPANLAIGIAAAVLYNHPDDPQAVTLEKELREKGLEAVLEDVCSLSADDPLAKLVREKMRAVKALLPA